MSVCTAFLPEHPPIPGYDFVRLVARNGSIMYRARRTGSDEQVVLRVYYQDGPRPADTQEGLLAQLDHPNILRVIELGEVGSRAFSAVEHVSSTLAEKLRDGPLAIGDALRLARTLALTLDYLRAKGMLHLNLTPASILLTPEMTPRLFDIQLMSTVERWDADRWVKAVRPSCNPPEAFKGGSRLSTRGDTYRVGATLYTMLVGRAPFTGKTSDVVDAVLNRAPIPPRQLNASVSKEVEAVCLRCLDKAPKHRHGSLESLATDLSSLSSLHG